MNTEVSFKDLDRAQVEQVADILIARMSDSYPDLDFSRGSVLYDLVISKLAASNTYISQYINAIQENWSLAYALQNPDEENEFVDLLLSNFGISKYQGARSYGKVQITLRRRVPVTVSENTTFVAGGLTFRPDKTYYAVTQDSSIQTSSDVVLAPSGDNWVFTITLVADEEGEESNLTKGTAFTLNPQPVFFFEARAVTDFAGGENVETSKDLVTRARQGITAKSISSPVNAEALLRDVVPSTSAVSFVGAGSEEMRRDRRGMLGIATGGKVDIYLKSQNSVEQDIIEVNDITVVGGKTIIHLDRTKVDGVVKFLGVTKRGESLLFSPIEPDEITWGIDTGDLTRKPDLETTQDAIFSSYQKLDIILDEDDIAARYDVHVYKLPFIATAQQYTMESGAASLFADILVKSPVPIFVSCSFEIKVREQIDEGLENNIIDSVVDAINRTNFQEELSTSTVIKAIEKNITNGYLKMPLLLEGELIKPTQETIWLRSTDSLKVPHLPEEGVTKKTCCFFTTRDHIDVKVSYV